MERTYRVVWITDRGKRGIHCPGPFTHQEACTVLTKITPRKDRRDLLEEIHPESPASLCVSGERYMVTRNDGVRAIACEECIRSLKWSELNPIVESYPVANDSPCMTEASEGAWCMTHGPIPGLQTS